MPQLSAVDKGVGFFPFRLAYTLREKQYNRLNARARAAIKMVPFPKETSAAPSRPSVWTWPGDCPKGLVAIVIRLSLHKHE